MINYLIDSENMGTKWISYLEENIEELDKAFLFYTDASKSISCKELSVLFSFIHQLETIHCQNGTANALDFQLVSYLGYLIRMDTKSTYCILSKDKGYDVVVNFWKEKGIHLVEEDPDVAVQSFDTTLTYHKLDRICHYVRNGVPFIATHMDTNCPTEYGFMPDCGAMCSLITDSTGVKPRFLGKPWKETVDMVAEITGYKAEEMAFVGDRLYTDVATGVNNGAKGFLVLTGEADMQTVAESDVEPTCIYDSLGEMRRYL